MSTITKNVNDVLELLEENGVLVSGVKTDFDERTWQEGFGKAKITVELSAREREEVGTEEP